ncbi:X-linked retinitis pigmentosa GTPase regulator-like isoform X2 [Schistocerca piceifrons]|uniref:X-linked retinitis pigmentosa GTPase regulator-like isoform X2 n=1 Tax=Schistocerca piceifrons TaxID=274613 RepID=UPI001F5F6124|nr:X-linked retinitis pigmentosa GTPase regulator-like isoform X2 [Schistocerca piceifrons]
MAGDEIDIPETGAIFTFGRSRFADNLPSRFYIRNDRIVDFDCGDEHTALVCETGRLYLFGSNDYGQLGMGHSNTVTKPKCVKTIKQYRITHVACGRAHTVVSTDSGFLLSWGANSDGQLGLGDYTGDALVPQPLTSWTAGRVCQLSAGSGHSVALSDAGDVYVWGNNADGQLGLTNSDSCVRIPTLLPLGQKVSQVSCGYYHSAFITEDGSLFTCGETENGKLGIPSGTSALARVDAGAKVVSVTCGGSHTVALTEEGGVLVFGSNERGQVGMGSRIVQCQKPSRLLLSCASDATVVDASCGESHSAFVTSNGYLYTCGDGRHGKLCMEDPKLMQPTKVTRLSGFFVEKEDSTVTQPLRQNQNQKLAPILRSSGSCESASDNGSESSSDSHKNEEQSGNLISSSVTVDIQNYVAQEETDIVDAESTPVSECNKVSQQEVKQSKIARFFSSMHLKRSQSLKEENGPRPLTQDHGRTQTGGGGDASKLENIKKPNMVHFGSQRKSKACLIL